jgi:hypothetical protein
MREMLHLMLPGILVFIRLAAVLNIIVVRIAMLLLTIGL